MRDRIETILAEYFSKETDVVGVYLFGSYASGNERKGSDIDVGIIFAAIDQNTMLQKKDCYVVELSRILRKDLHPVVMNSASQELLRQIFSKGKCVVANDPGDLARFRMVQFSRIADFGYYRKQMQRGLVRRIMGEPNIG